MGNPAILVALVALALVLVVAVRRALEVLVVDVRDGRIVHKRGRATAELLREIGDVAERSGETGRLVLRLEGGQVAVRSRGLSEGTEQRMRNVVGRFPKARLVQAPRL